MFYIEYGDSSPRQCQCDQTLKNVADDSNDTQVWAAALPHPACLLWWKDLGIEKSLSLSLSAYDTRFVAVSRLPPQSDSQWSTAAISCKTNSRKNCGNLTSHSTNYLCQVFRTYLSESREEFVRKGTCFAYYWFYSSSISYGIWRSFCFFLLSVYFVGLQIWISPHSRMESAGS
jgi:hypothetical protein